VFLVLCLVLEMFVVHHFPLGIYIYLYIYIYVYMYIYIYMCIDKFQDQSMYVINHSHYKLICCSPFPTRMLRRSPNIFIKPSVFSTPRLMSWVLSPAPPDVLEEMYKVHLCMYIFIFVVICSCQYLCNMFVCMYAWIYRLMYIFVCLLIYIDIRIFTFKECCKGAEERISLYVYIHIYMYIYIHIYLLRRAIKQPKSGYL
jgi:hypothetical protein